MALLLLSGCRLDLATTAELERDGSGVLALAITLDDALLTELDELAIDPTLEVTALAAELPEWDLDRTVDDDDAITLTLTREFVDASDMGPALRELSDGLADDDPALLFDVDLAVAEDGSAELDGEVALRPPATAGAELDGEVLGPSADELAALTAEVVHPRFDVWLPGPIEAHDADRVDGRTLSWEIPVDAARAVSATSAAPGIHEQPWVWVAVAAAFALALAAWLIVRRRRVRR